MGDECRQGRERARRDDIDVKVVQGFNPAAVDVGGGTGFSQNLTQESGLLLVGLDEVNMACSAESQNQAWKAGTTPEIRNGQLVAEGQQRQKLRRIQHVTAPKIRKCRRADQIDRAVPLDQEISIDLQADHRFT